MDSESRRFLRANLSFCKIESSSCDSGRRRLKHFTAKHLLFFSPECMLEEEVSQTFALNKRSVLYFVTFSCTELQRAE